ncbi:natural resistance-associated macrophage protein [Piedraia hortae CBS 480.64]|uniref:Natural resistance-associated macrophage protein n=1 Tax=Piedraia hortae CBS 480.64 TaxID=1314780 RepID=A0A6A7BXX4_9PEZI|nr:natural resistance-associated macrophage protein [Piedraia hortae CBS 480.64]
MSCGRMHQCFQTLRSYAKFIGPGFMVSVAYIDPGNYATDVSAGAAYRFKLLFAVLLSNLIAIFLQSLTIKLGSVTGLDLAQNCRKHLPKWLNYILFFFAESAIIATDIAEVYGTAIALNLLLHIPLVAGCAISIVDVMFILLFYNSDGSLRGLRLFETFVALLVLAVVICFCIQLSLIGSRAAVGEVFRGYLPSSTLIRGSALYQACGILGATVMPHSLYLGSSIVRARLKDFDSQRGAVVDKLWRPSVPAIKHCLSYSIAELAISLFTFALFVNSAILIVAAAWLSPSSSSPSLFTIHSLLSSTVSPAAGILFALALLLSGVSAGIVCTMSGQIICEGQLNLHLRPWVLRLLTRSVAILPSIVVAAATGKKGVNAALQASQVALSVILPFTAAPVVYFTARGRYMSVPSPERGGSVPMGNHWGTTALAVGVWGFLVVLNGALVVLVCLGKG